MKNQKRLLASVSYTAMKLVTVALPLSTVGLFAPTIAIDNAYAASTCGSSGGWAIDGSAPVNGECTLGDFDPTVNDGKQGNNKGAIVVDGDTVVIKGDFKTVVPFGNPNPSQYPDAKDVIEGSDIRWDDLKDSDFMKPDGTEGITIEDGATVGDIKNDFNGWRDEIGNSPISIETVRPGNKKQIVGKDKITGEDRAFDVYEKIDWTKYGNGTKPDGDISGAWDLSAGDGYYMPDYDIIRNPGSNIIKKLESKEGSVGLNLAKVQNGGTINVDIDGNLDARVKQGRIFMADGQGSNLNWIHGGYTLVNLSTKDHTNPSIDYEIISVTKPSPDPLSYPESIVGPDGKTYEIRVIKQVDDGNGNMVDVLDADATAKNINTYNEVLKSLLQAGQTPGLLTQKDYDTSLNKAFNNPNAPSGTGKTETKYYKVKRHNVLGEDDLLLAKGYNWDEKETNFLFSSTNGARINLDSNMASTIDLWDGIGIKAEGVGGGYTISENNTLIAENRDATVLANGASGLNKGNIQSDGVAVRIVNGGSDNGVNATGETYINKGKITGSTAIYIENARLDGKESIIINDGLATGNSTGINIQGDGTIAFENTSKGIINGGYEGVIIQGTDAKKFDNYGHITSSKGSGALLKNTDAVFNNYNSIYIGRNEQTELGDTPTDTSAKNGFGITVYEGKAYNHTGATITLGSKVDGAVGMQLGLGNGAAIVKNEGTIDMKAGWDIKAQGYRQYMSFGMLAVGNGDGSKRQVIQANGGVINVGGISAVGVGAIDYKAGETGYESLGGAYVLIEEGSVINVSKGYEGPGLNGEAEVFFRNYGVYADGNKAVVDLKGRINMDGESIIGAHARMGGIINIVNNDDTNGIFSENKTGTLYEVDHYDEYGRPIYKTDTNGKKIELKDENGNVLVGNIDMHQIGYFAYGRSSDNLTSSTINNSAKDLVLNTQSSTLFRVDGGAEFNGIGQSLTTTENAKYSTLIVGVGRNRDRGGNVLDDQYYTKVQTNDAKLLLEGEGSMGVYIGGGAQGVISGASNSSNGTATEILLNGKHSTGGAVDGRYQTIEGLYEVSNNGDIIEYDNTILTNYADVRTSENGSTGTGTGSDVTGFITRYGGLLINEGNIELMVGQNNTGIHVLEHGRLDNRKDITISSGVGMHIEGDVAYMADGTIRPYNVKAANIKNKGNIIVNDGDAGLLLDNYAFVEWYSGGGENDRIEAGGTANGIWFRGKYTDYNGREHESAYGAQIGVNKIVVTGTGNGVENDANTGWIAFDGTIIDVSGNSSGIRTAVSLSEEQLKISTDGTHAEMTGSTSKATINVSDNGVGYDFRASDKDGKDTILENWAIVNSGYTINGSDHAIGIHTNTSTGAENYAKVTMAAGADQVAWKAGTASYVVNNGELISESTALQTVVDLANRDNAKLTNADDTTGVAFTNTNKIHAATNQHIAVRGSKYNDYLIFNATGSDVIGLVNAGDGEDFLQWSDGKWDGGFSMGTGSKNSAVLNGSGAGATGTVNGTGINSIDLTTLNHALGSSGDEDILTLANLGQELASPDDTTNKAIKLGSLGGDDITRGTNIGNQWENIYLQNTRLEISGTIQLAGKATFMVDEDSTIYAGRGRNNSVGSSGSLDFILSGKIDMTDANDTDYSVTSAAYRDRFTINGNLIGNGGEVWLDTWLGTDKDGMNIAPSDQLILNGGQATGTTGLVINAYGERGTGEGTWHDGIKVVDSKNGATTSDNAFIISSKSQKFQSTADGRGAIMITGSAYVYRLEKGNADNSLGYDVYMDTDFQNDWYLRTDPYHPYYKSTVPLYEAYAGVLNEMSRLPTLQQRVGNRQWINSDSAALAAFATHLGQNSNEATKSDLSIVDPKTMSDQAEGVWVRWEGQHSHTDPRRTFSGAHHDLNYMTFQIGADFRVNDETKPDAWIAGVAMHYKTGKSKVMGSIYGAGELKPDGFGLDATLTYYGQKGMYMDLQAAITAYQTDIKTYMTKQDGMDNAKAHNIALSAEFGQKFALGNDWTLTPQVQFQWMKTDFDAFTDKMGAVISLNDGGESFITRAGVNATKETQWISDKGDLRRLFGYGIANVYYDALGNDVTTQIAELAVHYGEDRWTGGVGVGGTYNWDNDKYSLYGEVEVRSSLQNFGDSYGYGGTFGFKRSF